RRRAPRRARRPLRAGQRARAGRTRQAGEGSPLEARDRPEALRDGFEGSDRLPHQPARLAGGIMKISFVLFFVASVAFAGIENAKVVHHAGLSATLQSLPGEWVAYE